MATNADLLIRVTADVGAAASQFDTLQGSINGAARAAGTTNYTQLANDLDQAGLAARGLAGFGGAIVGAFGLATQTAAGFEKEMSAVKSLLDPTEVSVFGDRLRDLAIALGADAGLTVTTREAAAGIQELIKAGVPAQAVLDGAARAAIALSNATGVTVPEAAEIAAISMNAFHKNASDLGNVMDWLSGVSNATAADMTDLRFGLQMVGPVANMVGLSLEETTLALGLFAQNGLRGSDAGTSLKTMLMNLVPTTDKAAGLMRDLGIITKDGTNQFFDQTGKVKDLTGIHNVLATAMKGMSTQQALATLQILFGSDAIRAASILWRTSSADIDKYREAIGKLDVLTQAATRVENLSGALEIAGGSVEAMSIIFTQDFLPAIRSVVLTFAQAVSGLANMDPELRRILTAIVGVAGAVSLLVGGAVMAAPTVIRMAQSFAVLRTLLTPLVAPVLAVALAVGVLYVAWQRNWGGIQEIVESVVRIVRGAIGYLTGDLGGLNDMFSGVQRLFGADAAFRFYNALTLVASTIRTLREYFAGVIETGGVFYYTFYQLPAAIQPVALILGSIVSAVRDFISAADDLLSGRIDLPTFFSRMQTTIGSAGSNIQRGFETLFASIDWAAVWSTVTTIGQGIINAGVSIVNGLTTWLGQQFAAIDWAATWAAVQGAMAAGLASVSLAIAPIQRAIEDWWSRIDWVATWAAVQAEIASAVARIEFAVAPLRTAIETWWSSIDWPATWRAIQGAIAEGLAAISLAVAPVQRAIETWWSGIDWPATWTAIQGAIASGIATVSLAAAPIQQAIGTWWSSIDWVATWNAVKAAIGSGLGSLASIVTTIQAEIGRVWAGINWTEVWKSVTTIGSSIAASGLSIANEVLTFLKTTWQGVNWTEVWKSVTTIGQKLIDSGMSIISQVQTWVSTQFAGVNWGDVWNTVKGAAASAFGTLSGLTIDLFDWLFGRQEVVDQYGTTRMTTGFAQKLYADIKAGVEGLNWGEIWAGVRVTADQLGIGGVASVIEGLASGIRSFAEFLETPTGKGFLAFFGVVALELGVYTLATSAATLATAALSAAMGVLALLTSPITLVALAFAALIGIGVALYNSSPEFRAAIDSMIAVLKTAVENVVRFVGGIPAAIASIPGTVRNVISGITGVLNDFLYGTWETVFGGTRVRSGGFIAGIESIFGTIGRVIESVGKTLVGNNPLTILLGLLEKIGPIIESLTGVNPFAWIDNLTNLLPEWLRPHSPNTDLSDALSLILEILTKLAQLTNPFAWLAEVVRLWPALFGGPGTGGAGAGGAGSITVNGPLVQINGSVSSADADSIVDAIATAFELLAQGSPATATT